MKPSICVHIVINPMLREIYNRVDEGVYHLSRDSTVADMVKTLGLPDEAVMVVVNGRLSAFEDKLKDGDQVTILPQLGGG